MSLIRLLQLRWYVGRHCWVNKITREVVVQGVSTFTVHVPLPLQNRRSQLCSWVFTTCALPGSPSSPIFRPTDRDAWSCQCHSSQQASQTVARAFLKSCMSSRPWIKHPGFSISLLSTNPYAPKWDIKMWQTCVYKTLHQSLPLMQLPIRSMWQLTNKRVYHLRRRSSGWGITLFTHLLTASFQDG